MTPFRTIIIFILLSLAGLALVPRLKVNLNPPPNEPILYINYSVSESSPMVVEQLATSPLENAFSTLRDLKEINSVSNYNNGRITLRFDKKADMDYKRFEVAMLIRQIFPKLHEKVSYPYISESNQSRNNTFLQYTLNAPFAPFEIKKTGEDILGAVLAEYKEVDGYEFRGADDLGIKISFDRSKMIAMGIKKQDIISALQRDFGSWFPGLATIDQSQQLFIHINNEVLDLRTLEQCIVKREHMQPVRIKDVALVSLEEQEPGNYYRINAKSFVSLIINARDDINKVHTARLVKENLENARKRLPEAYELRLVYDETEFLEEELNKIYQRSGLSILILIFFIFLINRNPKYLLVLFSGIVVNLSITSLFIYFLDIPVHLYSLAGLTISFGLIVDNAIVMIDHLYKQRNKHIFLALLAASLTTISALLLVFFLPDEDRKNLTDFSVIIAVTLAVSLIVALFFTPAMHALLLTHKRQKDYLSKRAIKIRLKVFNIYKSVVFWLAAKRKWTTILLVLLFGLPVFMLPSKWQEYKWYNTTVGSDLYQEEMRPWVDKVLGGGLRLFVRHVYERSSYRENEKTKLYVNAGLPYGNTLQQMDVIIRDFENYLLQVEGLDVFTSYVMSGENARIEISFKEAYEKSALPYQLKARLSAKSTDWSGVRWSIYGVGQGFSTGGGEGIPSFRVKMLGYNADELEKQSEILADKLLAHKRIQEVNTNERLSYYERKSQEYILRTDAQKIASLGVSDGYLANVLQNYAKTSTSDLQLSLQSVIYPVFIADQSAGNFSKYALEHDALHADDERMIKVGDIGQLNLESTSNALHKENRQYVRIISFEYYGSARFGDQYLSEVLEEMKAQMPLGYSASKQTWTWGTAKTRKQYSLLLILILAIFFICSVLFENLKQPLFIILLIPVSFIGLFFTFGWFDFYFDQGGYAAFVMLGGLTVNAGIFIVHDLNLRNKQNNRQVIKAVASKAQPIILTILSTCFGLIPFVVHGQNEVFWFSLAAGTIGGLLFSLLGVFIYLPVWLIQLREDTAE